MTNAVQETTKWVGAVQPNHTYLLDGNRALAYIKQGATEPFYFKTPLTINLTGRTFKPVVPSPFKMVRASNTIEVSGSKGQTYFVNIVEKTCTCPGHLYRGSCRHVKELS